MKKRLAATLAGIMAAAVCASPVLAEGVTINVTTTYAGEDSNAQNFKDSVAAWEEESGNKVEDSSATSDESFKSRIITDFEAGSEPDVLFFFNGVDANQFVEQGKVVSIDEIREEYPDYASNMKDDMLGASPADGVNYSVPVNGYWEGMFVNKEVLEEAGVEVPGNETTWDEFLEMCGKIKDAGYTPIAASLQEIPHMRSRSGGYFPENTLTATDAETFQLFTSDKAAFLIDGSWKIGGIAEAVDDIENYTVTHVPGKGDRKTTDEIGGLSMGYYITRKAWDDDEKRDAAVSFVSFMTSDDVVSKFAGVSATALKEGASPDVSEFNSLQNDALAYTASFTGISPAVQDNLSAAAREPIFADMASIVNGDVDAADAVAAVLEANAE